MYQAIIFDLDGTLVSSLEDIADAANHALRQSGYPVHDYPAYKNFVGQGIRNLIKNALPEKTTDEEIQTVLDNFVNYYRRHLLDKTKMYDGIDKMLTDIEEKNLKTAVLSNKAHELTVSIVNKVFRNRQFDIVMGLSDKIKRKPDPEGALLIANQLNIAPQNIIFVGDSKFDVQTAKAAGMLSVAVSWGFRERDELIRENPDYLIDTPCELLSIICTRILKSFV